MKLKLLLAACAASAISAAAAGFDTTARRADRNFDFQEWAQAGALYELMLDERPDSAAVYSRAIVAASMLDDTLRSTALLERAMAHSVALDSVVDGVRRTAFAIGHAGVYADFLHRTRAQMPWMARALDARLLDYYAFRNDGERMVQLSEAMLSGLPDSERYLAQLARGHLLQGHTAEAEAAWRRLLDAHPDNLDALRSLGTLLMQQGRTDEGRALLRRVHDIAPTPYTDQLLRP